MSILSVHMSDDYLYFDEAECLSLGKGLAERYRDAVPFPHIVIDNFVSPDLIKRLLSGFPSVAGKEFFDRDQEKLKAQFGPEEVPGRQLRNLLVELNSRAFLGFLEEMTGISGLIPDPYFTGGGLHVTKKGGKLGIHADFNVHKKLKLERRLNLLIYLNDDWPESYGGNLELWNSTMTKCEVDISPIIGRAVVFSTSLDSFHGQPEPLKCPSDRARRSIATYYYTAPQDGTRSLPQRSTNFRTRPGTSDRPDRAMAFDHFLRDWMPPRLYRAASKLNMF